MRAPSRSPLFVFTTCLRWVLPCLLAVALAGCSMRVAYSHLDWLLPWYFSDYVTLDRDQRRLLDLRLADRLAWHCRHQLGPYAALLRGLEGDLRRGHIDAAELDAHLARGEALWRELMGVIVPDAGVLLASLTDAQITELAAAFEERNREVREEFLDGTPAERRARRAERMEKRLRPWFGSLQPAQRQLVERWSGALAATATEWLAQREQWQGQLLAALAQRRQGAAFEAALRPLLVAPEADWPADYRGRIDHNRAQTLNLLAALYDGATPGQRERLFGEIDAWAKQFERHACPPPRTAAARE